MSSKTNFTVLKKKTVLSDEQIADIIAINEALTQAKAGIGTHHEALKKEVLTCCKHRRNRNSTTHISKA